MYGIHVRRALYQTLAAAVWLPLTAFANESRPLPSAVNVSSVAQTIAWLIAVIGLAYACAWVARRFGVRPSLRRTSLIKVVSSTALTPKEKVMVVEIGSTWLVLGVAGGNVCTLHTMPAASDPPVTVN
ncbi:flagellar biosynthetic protein FliO [Mycoavidus sp. B2-EB]|uniref:flagellar biosynthetic protein FliO n=1 Tax=Mycoavidus sp. B2-EB TaxID=2651972 RepID=UPI001626F7A6|nr:flagellar biosynthetic protein FliO [Mycoavidus sp. B2-EB]BBO60422.1 flagellar protein [Mycoavidus sp. B2-EB]